MQICKDNDCFGCASCADICPVSAISMTDENGFYRPLIDSRKCISCGLCKSVCISNSMEKLPLIRQETNCFAAYSKNEEIHYEASSGGLCTEISKAIIALGGIVAGAWWNPEKQLVEHRICKCIDEIELLKKSKYVQSKMDGIYDSIEEHLMQSEICLFIGVPCQVYAIKRRFSEYKKNFYCIDLLCRGGASSKCLREHLKYLYNGKLEYISFRGGSDDCTLSLFDEKHKKIYRGPQYTDPYFFSFMEHMLFQEQCYRCPFAGRQRIGDLTIGDYWGLAEEAKPESGGDGINLVFQNDNKGNFLLELVKEKIEIVKRPAIEAINGNETLQYPTPMPDGYAEFWEIINREGYRSALNHYCLEKYETRIKKARNSWRKYRFFELLKKSDLINTTVKKLNSVLGFECNE